MTTDVVRNNATSSYGEDTLYKDKESGQLRVTVKNVGGLPTYGAYEYTIKIPEGVELKDSLKKQMNGIGLVLSKSYRMMKLQERLD